ncbi:MAG: alpha-1,4-glucan--maltose-1-phosphate maltosyltransferase [Lentisphaerales bacterium]|nr:alpha-1,4-glucan--maltose-1-phosphate maltosyltransferase [Lentisphaerales bacterium]
MEYQSILIQNVTPSVDGGKYPAKQRLGSDVKVSCEAFRHGHDAIKLILKHRRKGLKKWHETAMNCENGGLDFYSGSFTPDLIALYEFQVFGYTDHYHNWSKDTKKKLDAGEDLTSDLMAGIQLLEACQKRATPKKLAQDLKNTITYVKSLKTNDEKARKLLSDDIINLAGLAPDKDCPDCGESEIFKVRIDRKAVEYATWYEIFPRSAGKVEGQSGTFKDVENLLPYISGMGFDVLYFPPIHPIGLTKRKGKNNALTAQAGDPGSPYAIGDETGGHFAIHPELGTIDDFDHLVKTCADFGMEICLDFALNCSPDHPYLKEHPDWFYRRPDGTIKFAENPPKKYEDIYPLNFECEDKDNLWREIRDILLYWASHGVKTFRVDNPHTKPIQFWEWCIEEVLIKYPDVIFLSEAFTKPRVMESLAKIGYHQSYGYFTWRETKEELTEYFNYLNNTDVKDYMICNVFPTTPDIHPKYLHWAKPEMFKIRMALATMLSPVYGMYSGVELCENVPVGYKDELLNSEKYEYKVRNFDDPISISGLVTELNQIRRTNPALQKVGNLKFHDINNDKLICFTKYEEGNLLLIVINLDPEHEQSGMINFPFWEFNLPEHYKVHDLLTDEVYHWQGSENYISLNPLKQVAHIFRVF